MLSLIRLCGGVFCALLAAAGMGEGRGKYSTSTVYASYMFSKWRGLRGRGGNGCINSRMELLVS